MDRDDSGSASYVFRVEFRVEPGVDRIALDPARFETTLYRDADPPGRDGWLFFRDNLWHGEVGAPDHLRELAEEALGVAVTSVSFSELRTDERYLERLRAEIGANLEAFNADATEEAVSKYLGSSIRVVDDRADG